MNWILIRGLARSKPHWDHFPNLLKEEMGGEVICLDLPGVGAWQEIESPTLISTYADLLHEKFQKLKDKNSEAKWGLVAISLGGMIAIEWVSRYPADFEALVTMNTSAGNLCSPTERLSLEAITTIARLFLASDVARRERAILKLTTNLKDINEELVNRWVKIDQENPLKRSTFVRQLLAASRFKVPSKLPLEPLILVGEKDRLTRSTCSYKLAKHFNCQAIAHPEAGHDLPLDDPQWPVEQIVKRFKTS